MLIYMLTSPTDKNNGSQSGRDLYRQARHKLYTTTFADYEREIREQLTGMFGAFGFDAERDIEAITINRWSHGYAYDYMDYTTLNGQRARHPTNWVASPLVVSVLQTQILRIGLTSTERSMQPGGLSMSNWATGSKKTVTQHNC